jgi:nitronate monooxygenase
MGLRTRFTERFGIENPIMSAPMDLVATAALATSVSKAGGLGLIGGGYGNDSWLRTELEAADGTPVGCGFITWSISHELVDIALEYSPVALFLSFGDASPYVDRIHAAGVPVICQVHTIEQVRHALDIGADVICAQGGEAGGHGVGTRSTFTLVPESADVIAERRPEVLLVAAGGIGDGRGLAAALTLGADGVLVGTRFWATHQAVVPATAHARAVAIDGDATQRTSVFDIVREKPWPPIYTGRVWRNEFVDRWHGREAELKDGLDERRVAYQRAVEDEDFDHTNLIVGEIVGQVNSIEDAGDVVRSMASQAEQLLSRHVRAMA